MLPLVTFNGICICILQSVRASSARILPRLPTLSHQAILYFLSLCKYLRGILSGFFILSDLCRFSNPILTKNVVQLLGYGGGNT